MYRLNRLFWNAILHHYPQYNWSKTIESELDKLNLDKKVQIVDAPCGNGAISYWLSSHFSNGFELIDRSGFFAGIVSLWSKNSSNIEIKKGDLFESLSTHDSRDIWLLINSLYLFSNPEDLIQKYSKRFKFILAVFPYLEKENYQHFCKRPFRSSNPQKFTVEDTLAVFNVNNYVLKKKIDLTAIPFFKYEMFGLGAILRYPFSFMDKKLYPSNGQYWLGIFERK